MNTEHRMMLEVIGSAFGQQGLGFKVGVERGQYEGQTTPTPTGGFIHIGHHDGDDFMVKLKRADPAGLTTHEQTARGAIHEQIELALIHGRLLPGSQHFLRQNLFELGGIEVVKSLTRLLFVYDTIWLKLEDQNIRVRFQEALESFTKNKAQLLETVGATIARYIQVTPESKAVFVQGNVMFVEANTLTGISKLIGGKP